MYESRRNKGHSSPTILQGYTWIRSWTVKEELQCQVGLQYSVRHRARSLRNTPATPSQITLQPVVLIFRPHESLLRSDCFIEPCLGQRPKNRRQYALLQRAAVASARTLTSADVPFHRQLEQVNIHIGQLILPTAPMEYPAEENSSYSSESAQGGPPIGNAATVEAARICLGQYVQRDASTAGESRRTEPFASSASTAVELCTRKQSWRV